MSGFYRMEIKVVSRGGAHCNDNHALEAAAYIDAKEYRERSPVESAAYITGQKLKSETTATDYTHKKGVLFSEVVLPYGAPERYKNPEVLWSEVDRMECARKNAALFREWIVSLDCHLSDKQMRDVAREFAEKLAAEGMIVHYAIHDQKDNNGNFHIHLLAPTRSIDPQTGDFQKRKILPRTYALDDTGQRIPVLDKHTGQQKRTTSGEPLWKQTPPIYVDTFNDKRKGNAERWRKEFATIENKYLPPEYQVSADSYIKQEIDAIPGKHLGKAACRIQKRLEGQIAGIPQVKRQAYLEQILHQVQHDYRSVYYANTRDEKRIRRLAEDARWKLKQQIIQEMQETYKYRPQNTYYPEHWYDHLLIIGTLVKLYRFFTKEYNGAIYEKRNDDAKKLLQKVNQAETDILIAYAIGPTRVIENRLTTEDYELKKLLIKEIGEQIRKLEEEIERKEVSELNAQRISNKLTEYKQQLEDLRVAEPFGRTIGNNNESSEGFGTIASSLNTVTDNIERLRSAQRRAKQTAERIAARGTAKKLSSAKKGLHN